MAKDAVAAGLGAFNTCNALAHRDIDNAPTEYTVNVPSHGVVMLRVE